MTPIEKLALEIIEPQLKEVHLHELNVLGWGGTPQDPRKKYYFKQALEAADRILERWPEIEKIVERE